jgi:hypothetical protein
LEIDILFLCDRRNILCAFPHFILHYAVAFWLCSKRVRRLNNSGFNITQDITVPMYIDLSNLSYLAYIPSLTQKNELTMPSLNVCLFLITARWQLSLNFLCEWFHFGPPRVTLCTFLRLVIANNPHTKFSCRRYTGVT